MKTSIKQLEDRESGRQKIIRALASGRHLTFRNAPEFGIAEFNTAICKIRKDVVDGKIPFCPLPDAEGICSEKVLSRILG